MPALSTVRTNGEMAPYFKRKVAMGCSKMSVLNAVKSKLIQRIFACVKEDRLYVREREFVH
jgi:transposase